MGGECYPLRFRFFWQPFSEAMEIIVKEKVPGRLVGEELAGRVNNSAEDDRSDILDIVRGVYGDTDGIGLGV